MIIIQNSLLQKLIFLQTNIKNKQENMLIIQQSIKLIKI
jgi:hypothetical protein